MRDAQDLLDVTPDELREVEALVARGAPGVYAVLFERWARLVDEASKSQTPRLLVEMAAVELCAAEPLLPIGDLLDWLDELEARLAGGGPAPRGGGSAGGRPSPSSAAAAPGSRAWATPASSSAGPVSPAPSAAPASPPSPGRRRRAGAARGRRVAGRDRRAVLARFATKPVLGSRLAYASVTAFENGRPHARFSRQIHRRRRRQVPEGARGGGSVRRGPADQGRPLTAARECPDDPRVGGERRSGRCRRDKKNREVEARQHPIIQKAQDVFGASLKEVKTP